MKFLQYILISGVLVSTFSYSASCRICTCEYKNDGQSFTVSKSRSGLIPKGGIKYLDEKLTKSACSKVKRKCWSDHGIANSRMARSYPTNICDKKIKSSCSNCE